MLWELILYAQNLFTNISEHSLSWNEAISIPSGMATLISPDNFIVIKSSSEVIMRPGSNLTSTTH